MFVIIHKIKLRDIHYMDEFKQWVTTTDYAACHHLTSVKTFEVALVSEDEGAPFHFIEIIHVQMLSQFKNDMNSLLFQSLVTRFNEMADVIEETVATRVGDGYQLFC